MERSLQPLKKELLLCLSDLLEDDTATYDESCDWLDIKDRGGLTRVSHNMFLLISSMEIVVKNHIALNASLDNFSMKDELSSKIIQ